MAFCGCNPLNSFQHIITEFPGFADKLFKKFKFVLEFPAATRNVQTKFCIESPANRSPSLTQLTRRACLFPKQCQHDASQKITAFQQLFSQPKFRRCNDLSPVLNRQPFVLKRNGRICVSATCTRPPSRRRSFHSAKNSARGAIARLKSDLKRVFDHIFCRHVI